MGLGQNSVDFQALWIRHSFKLLHKIYFKILHFCPSILLQDFPYFVFALLITVKFQFISWPGWLVLKLSKIVWPWGGVDELREEGFFYFCIKAVSFSAWRGSLSWLFPCTFSLGKKYDTLYVYLWFLAHKETLNNDHRNIQKNCTIF